MMLRFRDIQAVCPWRKPYRAFGEDHTFNVCEPLERMRHGTFHKCKSTRCPLWAMEKLREIKK
jgi:hypothetical protein